ncbi:MAG: hypothetical protein KDD50_10945 [Bdellovibrionales bacterium]|nr:hypothetical protein [Bdellovibrionales bacterium]
MKKLAYVFSIVLFSACSLNTSIEGNLSSNNPNPSNSSEFKITTSAFSVNSGSSVSKTINVEGGSPPYTYSIQSGSGNIDNNTGVFTAPALAAGSTVIKVIDANGKSDQINITNYQTITNGPIYAMTTDSSGNMYFGGNFTKAFPNYTPNAAIFDIVQDKYLTGFLDTFSSGAVHSIKKYSSNQYVAIGAFTP